MNLKQRALAGVLGGFSATLVLSGLREAFTRVGLVFETAPMQVVDRVEELGLVGDLSPGGRRLLTLLAHFAYGMGTGTAFGFLRRERGGPRTGRRASCSRRSGCSRAGLSPRAGPSATPS